MISSKGAPVFWPVVCRGLSLHQGHGPGQACMNTRRAFLLVFFHRLFISD